jgi:hypothetical protein
MSTYVGGLMRGEVEVRGKAEPVQPEASSFDWQSRLAFPAITFDEFRQLPLYPRRELIEKNRIVNTDAYNRTMSELQSLRPWITGDAASQATLAMAPAVFTLQFRRSPFNYLVVAGIHEMLDEISSLRITQEELDLAKEFYAQANVPFFIPRYGEKSSTNTAAACRSRSTEFRKGGLCSRASRC